MKQSIFFLLLIIALSSAKAQVTFQKVYGASIYVGSQASSILQTSDSGYILTGGAGDSIIDGILLIKTNRYGDTLWTRIYGMYYGGNYLQQTLDGGYIITGSTDEYATYLLKTNSNGDTLWTKIYDSSGGYGGIVVAQTSDSGYMIAGTAENLGSGGRGDFILIKTDKNGDTLWSKCYGTYDNDSIQAGPNDDILYDMQQTKDGGYILAGVRELYHNSTQAALIIKTDSAGNPTWSHVYGVASDQYAYHAAWSIQQTTDGGYIINDRPGSTPELFKIDRNGGVLWIKYGPYGPVIQTKDGGYAMIMIGSGELIKTDSVGDVSWVKSYGENLGFNSIEQTNDSGFILAGGTNDSLGNATHCVIVKTDASGNSTCNITPYAYITGNDVLQIIDSAIIVTQVSPLLIDSPTVVGNIPLVVTPCMPLAVNEILNEHSIALYPNPTTNQLTLQIPSLHQNEPATILIINVLGQAVSQSEITNSKSEINVSFLSAGIYFVRVADESGSWVGRFVKE